MLGQVMPKEPLVPRPRVRLLAGPWYPSQNQTLDPPFQASAGPWQPCPGRKPEKPTVLKRRARIQSLDTALDKNTVQNLGTMTDGAVNRRAGECQRRQRHRASLPLVASKGAFLGTDWMCLAAPGDIERSWTRDGHLGRAH